MQLKNTNKAYGIIAILLHWLIALLIIGLFAVGVYMVELGYYHKWYNAAPWWHKSVGMLVFLLMFLRVGWTMTNVQPAHLPNYICIEIWLAKFTHMMFYILIFTICASGYLFTTATGAGIDIFGWFEFPALTKLDSEQAELLGEVHALASYVLGLFFSLHLVASCKHHFSDRDETLTRIINPAFKRR